MEIKPKSHQLNDKALAIMKEHIKLAEDGQARMRSIQKEVHEASSNSSAAILECMGLEPGQWSYDTSYLDDLGIAFVTGLSAQEIAEAQSSAIADAMAGRSKPGGEDEKGGTGGPGGGKPPRGPLN